MNLICFQNHILINKLGNLSYSLFQYKQVHDFVNALQRPYIIFCQLKDFEKWIIEIDMQRKLLSKIYSLLLSSKSVLDIARSQMDVGAKYRDF